MVNQSLVAGIVLILVRFSGFPSAWKDFAYVVVGIVLVVWALIEKNRFFGFFASKMHNQEMAVSAKDNENSNETETSANIQ
ncbi:MAG TPA: hypothetical protein VMR73_00430 [Candidatus Paceibacterota bacterium]|nr:hypothetical protein [Candidatus Paceibacterota bacterium]